MTIAEVAVMERVLSRIGLVFATDIYLLLKVAKPLISEFEYPIDAAADLLHREISTFTTQEIISGLRS